jgi:hypothetical protein
MISEGRGDILKHQTYDLIREISLKNQYYLCGLFEKGFGKRDLGEVACTYIHGCKHFTLFSLI